MGELGTFTKGAPLSKADITETGTPLILYGELYTTYGDIANTIVRKTDKNVKSECYSISGDVIIPTSGESPEEISTCTCVMQDGVILAGDLNIYRTNNVDGRFLSYEINHIRNREIAKIAQGKSIVHIKADELAKIVIRFPSKAEQSKIIELFSCLDRKIELQKKLIDSLKLYKRGLLSKLFPQKGKSVPQYRFAGFTDAWEQRKLGDTLCSLQNNTLSRAELTYEEGTIKNVHYGDILVKYGEILDVKNEQIPNIIDTTVAKKYKASFLQNGDVIFADTAEDETVGKCSEIAGLTDETALSGLHTIPYRPQLKFATGYLGYYLNSSVFHQQLIPLMQGIKVTSISKSAMQNTDIVYPKSFDEQEKIGTYFMHLDHLITLHQQKYSKMQSIKKFMLQNMFV